MKKLLATLAMTAALTSFGIAFAQPAEHDSSAAEHAGGEHAGGAEHAGGEHAAGAHHGHDPTLDFNWFSSPGAHYGKDVKGGPLGDGVMLDEHGNPILGPDGTPEPEEPMAPAFIWFLLNFVLLVVILAKFGKPAVEKMAADRHDQIKTALDEADRLRKQAADKLAEYDAKLAQAKSEIDQMVEGMRVDAEADKKRILEAAERQAAQMQRDAEQRIAAEIELARTQLTREVTVASIAAAEQLLRAKMTSGDQQKVVSTFIANVEESAKAAASPGKEAR